MTDEQYMRLAIQKTQEGILAGQTPFGAVLVAGDEVIAAAHNTVWRDCDPTAHAEINCIRQAARVRQTIFLRGCTLFTTTEPCPMCLAAIHWAKIERVVYGASIADAAAAGFCELCVDARVLAEMGKSPLRVEGGLLREECAALFAEWKRAGLSRPY
ncbi:MAG TPA: nucleoside deaminase [Gemmataceae bacterium]|jgi:tRNA(Arg) A34 adenosine deaminase TadA|nr:nucleoside deaminase [Gemmataceae bacterium]